MPMTPEKERELVEKMAIELCYADFVAPIDYGGADYYWQNCVIAKRKEVYRRRATAALRIAAPILRNEALEEGAGAVERLIDTDKIRRECCGNGVQSAYDEPPECCGDPDLMVTIGDAASAIRSLKTKDKPE